MEDFSMRLPLYKRVCAAILVVMTGSGVARADLPQAASKLAHEIERGDHPGIESFLLRTNGELVASYVAPALQDAPPDLRSATKSITALLIGIAIDRGEIPSVNALVVDMIPVFPKSHRWTRPGVYPLPRGWGESKRNPWNGAMSIEDLLTMRSGLDCDDWNADSPGHEDKMYRHADWLAFWADQPMREAPGERFSYCTGNVIALGAILERKTRMPVDRYAAKYLFEPLGIKRAEWARWGRQGIDTGGHLRLAPEDLLKIGELVLARGKVGDRQIVPEQWIRAMTTPHTTVPGSEHQYGYLWWLNHTRTGVPATDLWWAQGNGGNLLIVMPGVKSVMVVTGTRFNRPDALEPLAWLRERLLPEMAPYATVSASQSGG